MFRVRGRADSEYYEVCGVVYVAASLRRVTTSVQRVYYS
jgi:hypothetical protein